MPDLQSEATATGSGARVRTPDRVWCLAGDAVLPELLLRVIRKRLRQKDTKKNMSATPP